MRSLWLSAVVCLSGAIGSTVADGLPLSRELDTRCHTAADCKVADIGSCCGSHPACVNVKARPNPQAVRARCAAEGFAGVCGFVPVQECTCAAGVCVAGPGPGLQQ